MSDDIKPYVTWEQVLSFARRLEDGARNNAVSPEDGARLARLVIAFQENISLGVRKAEPGIMENPIARP